MSDLDTVYSSPWQRWPLRPGLASGPVLLTHASRGVCPEGREGAGGRATTPDCSG